MKNVLITGATGGIGKSLVDVFHSHGYVVCGTGTNIEKLNSLKELYKDRFEAVKCDLSNPTQIEELVSKSKKFYGITNILINNAGITKDNLFIRMKEDEWHEVIDLNLNSNFILTKILMLSLIHI